MKRTWQAVFCALLLAGASAVRADQTVAAVQQTLKDQGFYYGDVTGAKNADTTAAIRRYQIRNGLQITGEIDAETLRSLGVGHRTAPVQPTPKSADTPTPPPAREDEGQSAEISPERAPDESTERPDYSVPEPRGPQAGPSAVFDGTPFEMAPPDVQRHVIVGAQTLLARFGYYRSGIDGQFGPGTAAAVRAFQQRSGIIPDGRLNMETLAALGLLPGQHAPAFPFRRRAFPDRPVYRGQWIPQ